MYKMIYPRLNSVDEVSSFLEAHIQVDLRQLSNLCGASADDCILMLHDVMQRMKQGRGNNSKIILEVLIIQASFNVINKLMHSIAPIFFIILQL